MGQQYVVEYIKPVHSRPHQLYIYPDSLLFAGMQYNFISTPYNQWEYEKSTGQ